MINGSHEHDAEVTVTRFRPARWAAAAALAVAALVGVTPAASAATSSVRYVALGDSYTSGPLIPSQTGKPAGCQRSNHNYPSLVAAQLGPASFTDVSCSGATTADLTLPQTVTAGVNPAQFSALHSNTTLVSLGIGGNDIGFASILQQCVVRSPLRPLGAACRDFFTSGGADQLAARIDAVAPRIADALAGIHAKSPAARILLVGYPDILPQGRGCYPLIPFTPGDVAYLNQTEMELNAMLEAQASKAAAVDYVDTFTPTTGHDICRLPGTKWIEGLTPTSPAAPFHPNALGMVAMAEAVLDKVLATAATST